MLGDSKKSTRSRILRKFTMIDRDIDKILKHFKDLEDVYQNYPNHLEAVKIFAYTFIELQEKINTWVKENV